MRIERLRISNLRGIESVEADFGPRWNLLEGGNGAGKTTVLEAAFLLSHGRSFRSGPRDALVRHGSSGYAVYGELVSAAGTTRIGLARSGGVAEARLDGAGVPMGELFRHAAVLCFEADSARWIAGSSEERRQLLDWGTFHVEPSFLNHWRRCQRILKQRNSLLRAGATGGMLDAWDHELATAAEPLSAARQSFFALWRPRLESYLARLLPELGDSRLGFNPGYEAERPLAETLALRRESDLARGYTGAGPHRADWTLDFGPRLGRDHLSRGQLRLCALACLLGMVELLGESAGGTPVLCLDDLAAEIDERHRALVIELVDATGAQVLVTATESPRELLDPTLEVVRFHVERGHLRRLL